ncbi:MAG: hypothetical protein ACFCUE_00990 [Candidatus Bathyarchaeia archaeon]|jgi:predicted nucleic acid-binding protein
MPYVVIDTCVFVRLTGEHSNALDGVRINRDVIAISNQAISEYEVHFKPSRYLLLIFLQKLEREKIIKRFNSSFIESRLERISKNEKIHYPKDKTDRKWIELGVAVEARYILSIDYHLLVVPKILVNKHELEVVEPSSYLERINQMISDKIS